MKKKWMTIKEVFTENTFLNQHDEVVTLYKNEKWIEFNAIKLCEIRGGHDTCAIGDDIWDLRIFSDSESEHPSLHKFQFKNIKNIKLKYECKLIAYTWLFSPKRHTKGGYRKISTLNTQFNRLTTIYRLLSDYISSISDLSKPIIFHKFLNILDEKKNRGTGLSTQTISLYFQVLNRIQISSQELPFKLNLPLLKNTTFKSLAIQHSSHEKKTTRQTYAMPNRIMQEIIGNAIHVVEHYHQYRYKLELLEIVLYEAYTSGITLIENKIKSGAWKREVWVGQDNTLSRKAKQEAIKKIDYNTIIIRYMSDIDTMQGDNVSTYREYQKLISHIHTSCYIVLAGLTGMRASELITLHTKSLIIRDTDYELSSDISNRKYYSLTAATRKMVTDGEKHVEWITAPIAEKAISLASSLSANSRLILDDAGKTKLSNSIFLSHPSKTKLPGIRAFKSGKYKINTFKYAKQNLNNFIEKFNIILNEDDFEEFKILNINIPIPASELENIKIGLFWPFSIHQCRRTFAVFARRYDLCSNIDLKHQFKHLALPMTDWYCEGSQLAKIKGLNLDDELKKLISEGHIYNKTKDIYLLHKNQENIFGGGSKKIKNNMDFYPNIYKSWEQIESLVRSGKIDYVSTLHSGCLKGAECEMNNSLDPSSCVEHCPDVIITYEKALIWEKRHNNIIKLICELRKTNNLSKSQLSHYISQLRAAEKIMEFFKIRHNKYNLYIGIKTL